MNHQIGKMKKRFDEEIRLKKREDDQALQNRLREVENHRTQQYLLEDKKNQFSHQLENLLAQIFTDQNEKDTILDQKEQTQKDLISTLKQKDDLDKSVKSLSKSQDKLSQKIISLSSGNQIKQVDKEEIMSLLLQIVNEYSGLRMPRLYKTQWANHLNNITNMEQREEVEDILRRY